MFLEPSQSKPLATQPTFEYYMAQVPSNFEALPAAGRAAGSRRQTSLQFSVFSFQEERGSSL